MTCCDYYAGILSEHRVLLLCNFQEAAAAVAAHRQSSQDTLNIDCTIQVRPFALVEAASRLVADRRRWLVLHLQHHPFMRSWHERLALRDLAAPRGGRMPSKTQQGKLTHTNLSL